MANENFTKVYGLWVYEMKTIQIKLDCEDLWCGNCKRLSKTFLKYQIYTMCYQFIQQVYRKKGTDFMRLDECINSEVINE